MDTRTMELDIALNKAKAIQTEMLYAIGRVVLPVKIMDDYMDRIAKALEIEDV